jgi:hypothetical protein
MSKKLAEKERVNLADRNDMLRHQIEQLDNAAVCMANIATCYPTPYTESRLDVASEIVRIVRALNIAFKDLVAAVKDCSNMDKHEDKEDKVEAS